MPTTAKRKRGAARPRQTKSARTVALAAKPARAPSSRYATATRLDMRDTLARLGDLTPARLGEALRQAERGETATFVDLCDRMQTTDGDIRGKIETRTAAISGAEWVVEAGSSGDPERDRHAEAAAAFVSNVLENARGDDVDHGFDVMRVGFTGAVSKMLDAIPKGFSFLEIPWEYDEATRITAPRAFHWVHQRRFRWEPSDSTPRLVDDGETQSRPGEPLQPRRWIVHIPNTTGSYPWVSGVFRAIAWAYLFKRWCRRFWVSGAEAFSWPFIWAKVPRGADDATRAKALVGLEELSADHRAVVEDPVAFQILETTVKDAGTWKQLEDQLDREVSKAILGSTDQVDAGKVGAYAAVESRRGTTVEPRIAIDERNLAEDWERQFFLPLLDFNRHLFGGVLPAIPCIRWTIAAKRREIPQSVIATGKVRVDELRASAGLAPIGGPEGAAFISSGDETKIESVVKALELARGAGLQPTQDSIRSLLSRAGVDLEEIPDDRDSNDRDSKTLGEPAPAPAPVPAPAPAP